MKVKITIAGIVLLIGYMLMAGTNDPGHPMMSALADIQDAILSLSGEPEQVKENYVNHFKVNPAQNDALFVVPEGRQFVIRRLYASNPLQKSSTNWHLTADSTIILYGSINLTGAQTGSAGGHIYKFEHDFPDNCLTINSTETFNVVNNESSGALNITVIGYFRAMPIQ